jgi:hypothetical protein
VAREVEDDLGVGGDPHLLATSASRATVLAGLRRIDGVLQRLVALAFTRPSQHRSWGELNVPIRLLDPLVFVGTVAAPSRCNALDVGVVLKDDGAVEDGILA